MTWRGRRARQHEREAARRDRRATVSAAAAELLRARATLERATDVRDADPSDRDANAARKAARDAMLAAHRRWGEARMACARDDVLADLERLRADHNLDGLVDSQLGELTAELEALRDAVDELEMDLGR